MGIQLREYQEKAITVTHPLPKGRGLLRAACDQPSALEGCSRGSTQCFTSCHGSSP